MPSIKKPKYVDDTVVQEEDNRSMEDIVREVSLDEFLECKWHGKFFKMKHTGNLKKKLKEK